jgi:hypothetical protein
VSTGSLRFDLDFEGLELLADAYANGPETVYRETVEAGREAGPVIGNAIAVETPVDTGWLLQNEDVHLEGAFNIIFSDPVEYAEMVNRRDPFVDRGLAEAEPAVDAIYERALDRVAQSFAHGQ